MVENRSFERIEIGPGLSAGKIFGAEGRGRVMILGAPGSGKSTAALVLASAWERAHPAIGATLLAADPGSPHLGPPGAASLFSFQSGLWRLVHSEAVCALDAARFRMPLAWAAGALMAWAEEDRPLIIDMPGVHRGAAAAELFWQMARITRADAAVAISPLDEEAPPLAHELAASGLKIFLAAPEPAAAPLSKKARAVQRTALWDDYLKDAIDISFNIQKVPMVGNPPPIEAAEAWPGRQIALLDASGSTVSMGEVSTFTQEGVITARVRPFQRPWVSLMTRNARRGEDGLLRTSAPKVFGGFKTCAAPDMAPQAGAHHALAPCYPAKVGQADVILLNGLFGDPLLHLRLRDQRRSLLFDLGEATRLQARIAHQVSDVFISHAHIDHIAGFLWLLRSRIGLFPPCRLYGPPGLCAHIQGLMDGIMWDRIADRGPVFIVAEISDGKMSRFHLQAGSATPEPMGDMAVENGIILAETTFTIRCAQMDHGIPSMAYSFEQPAMLNVRKDVLVAEGLPSGKWLGELKLAILRDQTELTLAPPGHPPKKAGEWAEALLLRSPGVKMVYATDLGDTPQNRERLIDLAQEADLMFLEASFMLEDKDQANATWHLTAGACGQIARQAGVRRLAPFHLSRRYEKNPQSALAETRAEFPGIISP